MHHSAFHAQIMMNVVNVQKIEFNPRIVHAIFNTNIQVQLDSMINLAIIIIALLNVVPANMGKLIVFSVLELEKILQVVFVQTIIMNLMEIVYNVHLINT